MITDALLHLETSRADVRAANTYVSENTVDLSANRDIGANGMLKAVWNVETAYAGGTSIKFQQILSAAADLSSAVVIDEGVTVPLANLVAGALIVRPVPGLLGGPSGVTAPDDGYAGVGSVGLRYYGHQEVSVGVMTAGVHSSRLLEGVINVKHYPSGWSIL